MDDYASGVFDVLLESLVPSSDEGMDQLAMAREGHGESIATAIGHALPPDSPLPGHPGAPRVHHRNGDTVMTTAHRPGPVLRAVFRAPLRLYDWHAGWLLGHRFLRLTHVGRRSGRHYRTVVEVLHVDPVTGEVMVMAGFGRTTDWLRNIQAHPAVEISLGRDRFTPVHRVLDQPEAAAVLAEYERRNHLIAPIVRRVLSHLVGWRYDGSDEALHRLVRELPIIAFRPATQNQPPPTVH